MKNQLRNIRVFLSLLLVVCLSGCLRSTDEVNKQSVVFDKETLPVVVLGGGVAGLTAAIYLAQANIPVLVIEGQKPGGALSQSHGVRNWPGQYDVPGAEIVQKIKNHAIACGANVMQARVTAVNVHRVPLTFEIDPLADGQKTTIKAASCIIAMGTEPNFLNVPGEQGDGGYWGRGVSNCAVCDGFFFKGKKVVVVGGGDAAFEEASYLADLAAEVILLIRKDTFRANDIKARDRLLAKSNVTVLFNNYIKEIKGNGKKVTGVQLQDTKTNEQREMLVDGIFLAIGSRPNTDLFKEQIELDARGFVVLKDHQAASVPGVFAAGDVSDPHFVQAVTAAGDGCRAALQVKKYLEAIEYNVLPVPEKIAEKSTPVAVKTTDQQPVPRQVVSTVHGMIEIENEQMFKDIIVASRQPVLLDMFAAWCLPCQRMMPIVEKLAKEFDGKIVFAKLNVSNKNMNIEKLTPLIHGKAVYSVPTFIFIKNGKEVKRIEGSRDYEVLKKALTTTFEDSRNFAFVR